MIMIMRFTTHNSLERMPPVLGRYTHTPSIKRHRDYQKLKTTNDQGVININKRKLEREGRGGVRSTMVDPNPTPNPRGCQKKNNPHLCHPPPFFCGVKKQFLVPPVQEKDRFDWLKLPMI